MWGRVFVGMTLFPLSLSVRPSQHGDEFVGDGGKDSLCFCSDCDVTLKTFWGVGGGVGQGIHKTQTNFLIFS